MHHIVDDPLPDTPAKDVLLHVAFGDWQVSELTAMIAARTMGVPIHRPVTADGRSGEVEPGWGIDTLEYPSDGSGLVVWDSGSDPIPVEQASPSTSRVIRTVTRETTSTCGCRRRASCSTAN